MSAYLDSDTSKSCGAGERTHGSTAEREGHLELFEVCLIDERFVLLGRVDVLNRINEALELEEPSSVKP